MEAVKKTPKMKNINISQYCVQIHVPKQRKGASGLPLKQPSRAPRKANVERRVLRDALGGPSRGYRVELGGAWGGVGTFRAASAFV